MSNEHGSQITLALPPAAIAGRSIDELTESSDMAGLVVRATLSAARAGGYLPAEAEADYFDDPDEYAASDLVHGCPRCVALRDQRVASMRDGTRPVVIVITILTAQS